VYRELLWTRPRTTQTVEKKDVSLIFVTEHLIVLLHDIVDTLSWKVACTRGNCIVKVVVLVDQDDFITAE
jgi:hypothetical protein